MDCGIPFCQGSTGCPLGYFFKFLLFKILETLFQNGTIMFLKIIGGNNSNLLKKL